jgi:hypothetical protein
MVERMSLTHKQEAGIMVYVGNYGTYQLPPELSKIEGVAKAAADGRTKLHKLVKQWGEGRDMIEKAKHELNK